MATTAKPRDLRADDIVLSHFTLARHHDITERACAAAAADCNAIGLYVGDYRRLEEDGTAAALPGLLEEHGLCLAEIDALRLTADPTATPDAEAVEAEAAAFRMADRFASRSLHVLAPQADGAAMHGSEGTARREMGTQLARSFGALCDRASDHGLAVALEFMPTTAIASAAEALRIIEAADRPNGGLCIDAWHHFRGSGDPTQIRTLPGELIIDVQLSDGPIIPADPEYGGDTRRNRLPPGEGEMDLRGFVEAIRSTGTTAPWSLEVCNAAAWDTDGTEFVTRCASGLRHILEESP